MTTQEFESHFSKLAAVTDVRLIPRRRIGYVGYKTPEDAIKMVKYFNRTFIRMSKISVEIARPVSWTQRHNDMPLICTRLRIRLFHRRAKLQRK